MRTALVEPGYCSSIRCKADCADAAVHRLDEARILHVIEFRCHLAYLNGVSSPSHMSFRLLSRLPISRLLPWSFGSTFWKSAHRQNARVRSSAVKLVRGINVHSHFAHGAEGKLIAAFLQLFIQLAELLEDGVSIIFADVIGSLPYVLGETQKSLGDAGSCDGMSGASSMAFRTLRGLRPSTA